MSSRAWSVGVNYTSSDQIPMLDGLMGSGLVDHVEILIDNFLTVPASSIIAKFGDTPIAFHIMYSKFMESDEDVLRAMSIKLRSLIRDVKPLYVSDHVGRFTYEGRSMPILGEYDYERLNAAVVAVDQWQDLLGAQLLLENFPSYTSHGMAQPEFYQRLLTRTGAGLLFDISNAVIASHNAGVPLEDWRELTDACSHFHMGGYSEFEGEPTLLLDTHDGALNQATMAAAGRLFSKGCERSLTLTVEFDRNLDAHIWARDLQWAADLNPFHVTAV